MALMIIAAQAGAEEALPPGFLEYLGGMVEVEGAADAELLDPLDFENMLEPGMDGTAAAEPGQPEMKSDTGNRNHNAGKRHAGYHHGLGDSLRDLL